MNKQFDQLERTKDNIPYAKALIISRIQEFLEKNEVLVEISDNQIRDTKSADYKKLKKDIKHYSKFLVETGEQKSRKNQADVIVWLRIVRNNLGLIFRGFFCLIIGLLFLLLVYDSFENLWSSISRLLQGDRIPVQ